MNTTIAILKQRFSEPSVKTLKENNKCTIHWSGYEGNDRRVKLSCGHMLGLECIIEWALCTTPSERYQDCPFCQTELLPPSLCSRASVPVYYFDLCWRETLELCGGLWAIPLVIGLKIGSFPCQRFFQVGRLSAHRIRAPTMPDSGYIS